MTGDFLGEYSYDLPRELLAAEPAEPRDSARLLIVDAGNGTLSDSTFAHLSSALPKGTLLVFNETKVVPARIRLSKKTGGGIEVLFYVNTWNGGRHIEGIVDRKLLPGDTLFFEDREICKATDQKENLFTFLLSIKENQFTDLLLSRGSMPIPAYIKETALSRDELRTKYQTVFAKNQGSVAAPTASLHFTPALFDSLRLRGIETAYLTLHVGAGTFAPVTDREISAGKLHLEPYIVPDTTLNAIRRAKAEGRPVIPVGTTALRALESIDLSAERTVSGQTDIFIRKPHQFKIADGLITNFHVPRSSLMCLVDAFLHFKGTPKGILDIYKTAIERGYRFYSFGDGMLIY